MKKIFVEDYTLKSLSEERILPLLFREKTAVMSSLTRFGVDAVELAAIKNLKEDTVIYRTLASAAGDCMVSLPLAFPASGTKDFAEASRTAALQAWECIKDAENPCLQVAVPMSAVQLEYLCGVKPKALPEIVESMVKASKEYCACVEFVAMDATRADRKLLVDICAAAQGYGATAITLCDDEGTAFPADIAAVVSDVVNAVSVPVYIKPSDNISLAVANAFAAIEAGCLGVKTSVCGKNALITDKFAAAFGAKAAGLDLECGLKTTEIHSSIESMLKKISHEDYLSNGSSGGKGDVFLDAASTITDVSAAVRTLGYDLSDEDNGRVYDALMHICEKKSSVGAKELEAIVASAAMQAPSTYHLESYIISTSNITTAMAHITLVRDGVKLSGVATGDGPIDSAFMAIEQTIGHHYELDDFQIQAVTEGKESLGATLVKLRSGGKLYSGNGLSTDIVGASIRAYINALNKIVFEEN